MKTYKIATRDGVTETRKGHIVRVRGIDFALHKVRGGYACDHARTGLSVWQLDARTLFGPAVTLKEAKADLMGEGAAKLVEGNIDTFARAPTLNEGFA